MPTAYDLPPPPIDAHILTRKKKGRPPPGMSDRELVLSPQLEGPGGVGPSSEWDRQGYSALNGEPRKKSVNASDENAQEEVPWWRDCDSKEVGMLGGTVAARGVPGVWGAPGESGGWGDLGVQDSRPPPADPAQIHWTSRIPRRHSAP